MRLQRNEEEAVKRLHGTRAKRLWQRDEMVCQHCPDKLLEQHVPQSESVLYLVLAFLSLIRLIIWQIVLSIWKMTFDANRPVMDLASRLALQLVMD